MSMDKNFYLLARPITVFFKDLPNARCIHPSARMSPWFCHFYASVTETFGAGGTLFLECVRP